jgi:hypothetical protein
MKLLSTAKIQKVVDQAGTNNVERNMFLTIMLQEIFTKQVGLIMVKSPSHAVSLQRILCMGPHFTQCRNDDSKTENYVIVPSSFIPSSLGM